MGALAAVVPTRRVLGMRVDATSYQHATAEILRWGSLGESCYVCIATVNNVIEAYDDPAYRAVMDGAALVTTDGVPLVWALRLLGVDGATRVYGPDLTPILCERAAALGVIGLGAPKQERWMADRKGAIEAVMIGVGAAFDFLAGRKRQAPAILQRLQLTGWGRVGVPARRFGMS